MSELGGGARVARALRDRNPAQAGHAARVVQNHALHRVNSAGAGREDLGTTWPQRCACRCSWPQRRYPQLCTAETAMLRTPNGRHHRPRQRSQMVAGGPRSATPGYRGIINADPGRGRRLTWRLCLDSRCHTTPRWGRDVNLESYSQPQHPSGSRGPPRACSWVNQMVSYSPTLPPLGSSCPSNRHGKRRFEGQERNFWGAGDAVARVRQRARDYRVCQRDGGEDPQGAGRARSGHVLRGRGGQPAFGSRSKAKGQTHVSCLDTGGGGQRQAHVSASQSSGRGGVLRKMDHGQSRSAPEHLLG
jgi:hypothetical protein